MANENAPAPEAAPAKAVVFGDIQESDIELPSDKGREAPPAAKEDAAPESELEEDDVIEEEKKPAPGKRELGEETEDELEEDAEDSEGETEEEETEEGGSEDGEKTDAEDEYTDMSKGGIAKALAKMAPKERDKVLSEIEVPVKVDGEVVSVNLAELKRSYASKTATTREYYKVREWKEKLEKELQVINGTINPAWQELRKKNIEGALFELAKVAGFSKLEIKRSLRAAMTDGIIKYNNLTPEQRKHYDLEEEVEEQREANKERKTREEKTRALAEREQSRYRFQAQYGISDAQYNEAAGYLLRERLGGDESKLTNDGILEYVVTVKAIDGALELVELETPSLKGNEVFTDRVIRLCKKYPGASRKALAKKIQQIAGEYRTKKDKDDTELKKDIGRKVLKSKPKSAFQNPDKQNKPKPKSFDDILL